MTLAAGDLTTPARVATWLGLTSGTPASFTQLVSSMSSMIYSKLNRQRIFSQTVTRVIDGVGNYQILLPDYPVTSVTTVQMGSILVPASMLPVVSNGQITQTSPNQGYGYRFVPWGGNLPGDPSMLEFIGGIFYIGIQNVKITYTAGYLIQNEAHTVPSGAPPTVTVDQYQGICSLDNGVYYASSGIALTPVSSAPATGEYIPPVDSAPGVYTFSAGDIGAGLLFNYSFVPADLEEACIQMVTERWKYSSRIGEVSKSLGGQETIRYLRGGDRNAMFPELPPEVSMLISPYVSVVNPAIGAPL